MMAYDNLPAAMTDAPTLDQHLATLRESYSDVLPMVMDDVTGDLILPDHQIAVLYDMAQFFTFMTAVKIVEARRQPVTRDNLMAAYWPMQKVLKDEVPGMLRQLAEAVGLARAATAEPAQAEHDPSCTCADCIPF